MSNSRVLLTNYASAAAGAFVLSGSGGGAPARVEVSPYLIERAMNADRWSLWQANTAGGFDLDLDLGSPSIEAVALLGLTSSTLANVTVKSQVGGAYNPAGVWTTRGTIMGLGSLTRDAHITFAARAEEFWRLSFSDGRFTLGRLWMGPITDLGFMSGPGSSSSPHRNRIEQGQPDGSLVMNDLGSPGRDISLRVPTQQAAGRNALLALSDQAGSFVLLDQDDNCFEVIVPGGAIGNSVRSKADLFDLQANMVRLP